MKLQSPKRRIWGMKEIIHKSVTKITKCYQDHTKSTRSSPHGKAFQSKERRTKDASLTVDPTINTTPQALQQHSHLFVPFVTWTRQQVSYIDTFWMNLCLKVQHV